MVLVLIGAWIGRVLPAIYNPKKVSWTRQLQPLIDDYSGGAEHLDDDEVDRLCHLIKAKINLHQGNITEEEYEDTVFKGHHHV